MMGRPRSLYDVEDPKAFVAKQAAKTKQLEASLHSMQTQQKPKLDAMREESALWETLFRMDNLEVSVT